MIVVIASIKAKAGKEKELEESLKGLFPMVKKEEGTLTYILNKAVDEPARFTFYEKFENKNAFDFHNATPYIQELFSKFDLLLEEKPEIIIYEEIASIN